MVGENIKRARIAAGMSRSKMCDALGIPIRTIQSWELGERECPLWAERLIIAELKRIRESKKSK